MSDCAFLLAFWDLAIVGGNPEIARIENAVTLNCEELHSGCGAEPSELT